MSWQDLPFDEIPFIAFDTETTGREPARARIVELAGVKLQGGEVIDTFSELVNPGIPIPREAASTHGISDSEVRGARPAGPVLEAFFAFAGEQAVLVAHNASFDLDVVSFNAARAGIPVPPLEALDTLSLARRCLPGLASYTLESLCRGLSLPGETFHRALADARVTADLLLYCLREHVTQPTVRAAREQVGAPLPLRPAPPLPRDLQALARTVQEALARRAEVSLELRQGPGRVVTRRVRPLAAYAAPTGAYLDVAAHDAPDGVEMIPLESVQSASVVSGGQALLFG